MIPSEGIRLGIFAPVYTRTPVQETKVALSASLGACSNIPLTHRLLPLALLAATPSAHCFRPTLPTTPSRPAHLPECEPCLYRVLYLSRLKVRTQWGLAEGDGGQNFGERLALPVEVTMSGKCTEPYCVWSRHTEASGFGERGQCGGTEPTLAAVECRGCGWEVAGGAGRGWMVRRALDLRVERGKSEWEGVGDLAVL